MTRRSGLRRCGLALAGALFALLLMAPSALGTFHLIKVREIHPSSGDDAYVELQMFASGQNFLATHSLTVYNTAGALVHSSTFNSTVPKAENQRTVLIGDSGVQATYGVAPDLVDSALSIPAAGGAVCWNAGGLPADCVAWGNFTGGTALQTSAGTGVGTPASAGGIGAGKALRRSIAPGCPTLLEESDDSDSSATDFAEVTPAPRNNASAITEATCAGAPNTAIDDRPALSSNATSAEFTYEAPTATGYECKLDAAAFAGCPIDGQEYTGLTEGSHTFQVRGFNVSGPDPTPASYTWTVDTTAPSTTLDTHPVDPSRGDSAAFTFHASETGAKFECSAVPTGQPDSFSACTSGKTYTALPNGQFVFKVRATDLAGNPQSTPTSFSWEVDNSLADTTPPQTTILAKPADPSTSSTASFTYGSNEPGSSFECSLDGAAFAACSTAGITYSGLAGGAHSFQVRAIDPSLNKDPSPAGYSFQVVLAPPSDPGSGGGGGGPVPSPSAGGDPRKPEPQPPTLTPDTTIAAKPAAKTADRTPTFRFRAVAGASFQCKLDKGPFKVCRSPYTTPTLAPGKHTLLVRAVVGGQADPSPASFSFKVVRRR
ncbi:MAG: hypothetical protein ABW065_11825 [Solirubrobacterales bacterium]